MKNLLRVIILLCIKWGLLTESVEAATYYFSTTDGDDSRTSAQAQSSSTPWQSINKLNSSMNLFVAGDQILFKRGDVFYGAITIGKSGSSGNNIVFDAYGTGANPVITGLQAVTSWTSIGGSKYTATLSGGLSTLNILTVNNVFQPIGRYPKTTYVKATSTGTTSQINGNTSGFPSFVGGEVVWRPYHWVLWRGTVTSQSGTTVGMTPFASTSGGSAYALPSGYGFFFQNSPNACTQQGDWAYSGTTITMYSTTTPSNIKAVNVTDLVTLSGRSFITFQNITFDGGNTNVINCANSPNITFNGCTIKNGGVYGIFFNGTSTNSTVNNCTIDFCNSNGIKYATQATGATLTNSTISNIGTIAGMGGSGEGQYFGVQDMKGTCTGNSFINHGYIALCFAGTNNTISNNFINNYSYVKDDGSGIYAGGNNAGTTKVFNNIIINGQGAPDGTPDTDKRSFGIYMDDGQSSVEIYNNSIAHINRSGIFLHNAHEINMHDNTIFDCLRSSIEAYHDGSTNLANLQFNGNMNVALTGSQQVMYNIASAYISTANNNYYCRPLAETSIFTTLTSGNINLAGWKTFTGKEGNSKGSPVTVTDAAKIRFEYNATNSSTTVNLGATYMDATGKNYAGSITLAPYTSAVLIYGSGTIANQSPVANAGSNQTISQPSNSVTLDGSNSKDPDGSITTYAWSKVSGPAQGSITNASGMTTTATNLTQGTYVFKLTVTDNSNATGADSVVITVNGVLNQTPVANAGANQTITLPTNSITLNGNASSDPDGSISSYAWTKVSGPSSGTITSPSGSTTTVTNLAQGTYVFKLTVTDNGNITAADSVTITVNAIANKPPVANAGANQTITLPSNTVTLNGSASSDPDGTISSYTWSKVSGPAQGTITSTTGATTTVTNLAQGTYTFKLTVKDNSNATAADSVTITVNAAANQPPVANAGANQTITLPSNTVTLNGSASSDADGTISSYTWSKLSGPSQGTISTSTSATTTVTNLAQGTYTFKLTVKDNSNATASDSVTITVNAAANKPPVANAGANQTITLPSNTVTLNGSASSDPDGSISSYTWSKVSGPGQGTIANTTSASTTATNLAQGVYIFKLTVKDNNNATDADSVIITVNAAANQPPVANAGANQTITLPVNSVTLNGSASSDEDGTISSYTWTKSSGPAQATISNATNATTTVTALVQGTYTFKLAVKDDDNATATDSVIITVNAPVNQPPVANAGLNQTITLPTNSVTLNGTASSDADGSIVSYSWTKISGGTASIANGTNSSTLVNNLQAGQYIFQLTITDNSGATSSKTVRITVLNAADQNPVADAGQSQTITLPANSVTLNGTGSVDPDGTISSYTWSKVSGPAQGGIANAGNATTTVNNLAQGVYTFKLTVTDNNGNSASDSVTITVNAAVNKLPIANAGASLTITLPVNTANLDASASSDPDGNIVSYKWNKISGGAATIADDAASKTNVSGLVAGQYTFELTVTDNSGATSKAQVKIRVNAAANQSPVANAGSNMNITLPVNSATLDGSASSDPDGTIVSYQWVKISGGAATITDAATSKATVSGLVAGQYTFELTVTDNRGATSKAQMKVTVNAVVNKAPIANAGASQNITLPINTGTLDGSGSSDPDGSIVSYKWVKLSGGAATIADANVSKTSVSGLTAGQYSFELTVTDDKGATSKAQVKITVNAAQNQPPVANAGSNITITLPVNSVTLNGSNSSDPDGTIASYSWVKTAGGSATIGSANTATPSVSGLIAGQYTFELTVTDNNGASSKAQVKVTVNETPDQSPVANAGADQTLPFGTASVTLDGSKSSDPDGQISSYNWTLVSGADVTITNGNTATPVINGLQGGQYTFELTVTDDRGATAKAQVKIIVNQSSNLPPVADAGSNQNVNLSSNTANTKLDGTKSYDPDGTIVSFTWMRIDGPSSVTITNVNTSTPIVSGLVAGVYTFELTVTDNRGASTKAQVKITVRQSDNAPPVADAGTDVTVTLPKSNNKGGVSVQLDGTKSYDPDGTIYFYSWMKTDGPSAVTITNVNKPLATVSGLQVGQYTFQLTVTDNKGAASTDEITVIVKPAPDQLPIADAGDDVTVTAPESTAALDGSNSSDSQGGLTYKWEQVSGPSVSDISSVTSARISVKNLAIGQYIFKLTVKNSRGTEASDEVKVNVINGTKGYAKMELYPNPASSVVNAKITSDSIGVVVLNIYDINGRAVKKIELNKQLVDNLRQQVQRRDVNNNPINATEVYFTFPINVSALGNGVYVLETIIDQKVRIATKFVKY